MQLQSLRAWDCICTRAAATNYSISAASPPWAPSNASHHVLQADAPLGCHPHTGQWLPQRASSYRAPAFIGGSTRNDTPRGREKREEAGGAPGRAGYKGAQAGAAGWQPVEAASARSTMHSCAERIARAFPFLLVLYFMTQPRYWSCPGTQGAESVSPLTHTCLYGLYSTLTTVDSFMKTHVFIQVYMACNPSIH